MHRNTDPACSRYKPPTNPLARWLHTRRRGKVCRTCFPQTHDTASAEAWLDELLDTYGRQQTPGVGP